MTAMNRANFRTDTMAPWSPSLCWQPAMGSLSCTCPPSSRSSGSFLLVVTAQEHAVSSSLFLHPTTGALTSLRAESVCACNSDGASESGIMSLWKRSEELQGCAFRYLLFTSIFLSLRVSARTRCVCTGCSMSPQTGEAPGKSQCVGSKQEITTCLHVLL